MARVACAVFVASILIMGSTLQQAHAEWYADLYGGAALTNHHKVTEASSLGVDLHFNDVKFRTSGLLGIRGGYWLESVPWLGFGVDVFAFRPTIKTQSVVLNALGSNLGTTQFDKTSLGVLGIGFDVLRLRLPLLTSDEFPHGRVQPYVTAGPALFVTRTKDTDNFTPNNQRDTDTSLGVKAGAGISFQLTQLIALFGEYRFTHFRTHATFTDPPLRPHKKRSA